MLRNIHDGVLCCSKNQTQRTNVELEENCNNFIDREFIKPKTDLMYADFKDRIFFIEYLQRDIDMGKIEGNITPGC